MKVTLIAPTINEVEALREVMPKLAAIDKNLLHEIIVADFKSTDGTVEYCIDNGHRIHHQQNRGYGAAYMEVIPQTQADIIIEFPPDGSSPPERVADLISKINEGYDMVIASRYKDGAKSYDDDIITRFGNWLFTSMVNVLFHTKYTDVLVGFRAYRRTALEKARLTATGMPWVIQQAIRFARTGARITEIGVDEPRRIGGVRKMKPIRTGLEMLRTIIKEFFDKD